MLSRSNKGPCRLARWLPAELAHRLAGWLALALASALLLAGPVQAGEGGGPQRSAASALAIDANEARVIVKYRSASTLALDAAGQPHHAGRLGRQLALPLEDGHVLGRRTQSLRGRGLSSAALAARLAALPEVEWAVPVGRKTIRAVQPNDPFYADGQTNTTPAAGQWYLRAPDSTLVAAINAVGAWAITEGSASVTVAVLDTGVRFDHPDFIKSDLLSSKLWPGYDFVSRSSASNDGGGRDNDASDPGDWSVASDSCGVASSSWHGTQVAGLIGAATDNGVGMAGVGRNVMVLPVRVLGKCGGFDDDIIAGMRWAAGLSNSATCNAAGISATRAENCNPRPARVINMSLGSPGLKPCSSGYADVIRELTFVGVAVVVAAGNGVGRAVNEPANCAGAIAVSGVRHAGTKVGYSNLGPEVAVAAPAGNCVTVPGTCVYPLLTTSNEGLTDPSIHSYSDSRGRIQTSAGPKDYSSLGTSFSAPLVAGTVGLMLSVDPRLTPAQIRDTLLATARPFPATGAQEGTAVACRAPGEFDQIECYCTASTCGAGLLDAGAAVARVQLATLIPVARISASTTAPVVGSSGTLNGAGSTASAGRSITSYRWSLSSGIGLASFTGATDGNSATLATVGVGQVEVQLLVTDSFGASHSSSQTLSVAAVPVVVTPPTASGGGGGAMGAEWLLGLALAVLALLRARPVRLRA